jgi:hypothetical protein
VLVPATHLLPSGFFVGSINHFNEASFRFTFLVCILPSLPKLASFTQKSPFLSGADITIPTCQ